MDLLEDDEVKVTYDKCKYIVKLWEHNFKKSNGRVPSKLDIRDADRNVRDAYRKYFQLKSAALEKSFKDVEGFFSDEEEKTQNIQEPANNETIQETATEIPEDTWGTHLDKTVDIDESKTGSGRSTPNLNSAFAKKLFCGSKFSKRNPRKSMSFTHRKSETIESPQFLSQVTSSNKVINSDSLTESEAAITSFEGLFSGPTVKIINNIQKIATQSTNIIQSVMEHKCKPLKSVDCGWMTRVEQSTGLPQEDDENFSLCYGSDGGSEDIIENSDEDTSGNAGYPMKRFKASLPSGKNSQNPQKNPTPDIREDIPLVVRAEKNQEKAPDKSKLEVLGERGGKSEISEEMGEIRRSARPHKAIYELAGVSNSESDDPYKTDHDSDDPEFDLNEKSDKKILFMLQNSPESEVSPKTLLNKNYKATKKAKKKEEPDKVEEDDQESAPYELEYSIKPRVSAPRFRNLKKLIKSGRSQNHSGDNTDEATTDEIKTKRQQMKEKLAKKVESGGLNENFVTINLKKKIYARGKKTMNFSKFKKAQWKTKNKALCGPDMDMGGCDGGSLTCFNCGGVGHFARNCTKTKGDSLLPAQAFEEEEGGPPTLEEAAQMAKDSILAIRTPNIDDNKQNDEESEDSDDIFDDGDTEALLAETLKLEEHVAKLDLAQYLDYVRVEEPLYSLEDDGSLKDTPPEVFEALRKFGHSSFRPGQERAIMRILSGKSTLVTLSTGSGKSLCYQLPAYLYAKRSPCIALIISPLVSLMEDQVTGIPSFLKAACLHTNKTKSQREKVLEAISSGCLDVLLVSPEAVVAGEKSSAFGSLLRKLPPIAFACIDEAHCVSQWSHNFRPSYLMICRVLRERLGVKTVLGLTATATRATCDSIISHLQIADGHEGVISDTPLPDNLSLTVSKDSNRDSALLRLLTSERFVNCKSIIIYCTRRDECNRITSFLRTSLQNSSCKPADGTKKRKRLSVQAEPYHAGLPASRRRTIQKAFMTGELRIVVATVAFGMGINKSDIRAVIHYNMPKSFESYVQEIGRAGRDGLEAHCHLFLDAKGSDENELRRHIHANSIDRYVIRKLLEKIFVRCACKARCPKHEVGFSIEETVRELDIPEENISTILCYLELHQNHYIQLLSPAYTRCKVISYGGPQAIARAAKVCPPLAMALALKKAQTDAKEENVLEFAVVDIAAAIGWDSGICKHKLKNLEWASVNGQPKRSMLTVQLSNLGFRLLAPGNLTENQLDEALDNLYQHVVKQETTALLQLRAVHQTLIEVASPTYHTYLTRENSEETVDKLKTKIRSYFDSPNPLETIKLISDDEKLVDEELLVNNIRCLINMYRDNSFTGRAIARIFHGIMSPNYPAVIWGRCKFWRSHINVDFHTICKIATREILKLR